MNILHVIHVLKERIRTSLATENVCRVLKVLQILQMAADHVIYTIVQLVTSLLTMPSALRVRMASSNQLLAHKHV